MTEPAQAGARAAARRLAAELGPQLPADVERALQLRGASQQPDRYLDPVSLGSLIVSIATLAWTAYTDLKARTATPASEVVARTVRVQLEPPGELPPDQRDRIIAVTVEETIRADDY
jgi:hypothetical protein